MKSFGSGTAPGGRLAEAVAGPATPPAGSRPDLARDRRAARDRSQSRPEAFVAATTEPVAPAGIGAYLIAIGLILATTAAVLAGGWIGGAQATLLVAVVAVLEAVLLGRSGMGRLAALGLAIPLCAAVVVPTTIGLLPASVSHLGFQHTVGEYIVQAFGGLLATGPDYFIQWAFMVGLSTIIWACGGGEGDTSSRPSAGCWPPARTTSSSGLSWSGSRRSSGLAGTGWAGWHSGSGAGSLPSCPRSWSSP